MTLTGTKKTLIDLIKKKGSLSLDEATVKTDLAKTTLREHLLQLEKDGYIHREYVKSGAGRPSLHYEMTQKGNSLFPSSESELLSALIRFFKRENGEEMLNSFFESFWKNRVTKAKRRMDDFSLEDPKFRAQGLAQILEEEGFMPEFDYDKKQKTLTVKECNCPFSELVKETRLPCQLEAQFFKELFNENVERTEYFLDGDFSCTYKIPIE